MNVVNICYKCGQVLTDEAFVYSPNLKDLDPAASEIPGVVCFDCYLKLKQDEEDACDSRILHTWHSSSAYYGIEGPEADEDENASHNYDDDPPCDIWDNHEDKDEDEVPWEDEDDEDEVPWEDEDEQYYTVADSYSARYKDEEDHACYGRCCSDCLLRGPSCLQREE